MGLDCIDIGRWERRECFEHFTKIAGYSYSITVNIDVAKLYKYLAFNSRYMI